MEMENLRHENEPDLRRVLCRGHLAERSDSLFTIRFASKSLNNDTLTGVYKKAEIEGVGFTSD